MFRDLELIERIQGEDQEESGLAVWWRVLVLTSHCLHGRKLVEPRLDVSAAPQILF